MSARRFTLDANVLIYAFDTRYPSKQAAAQHIVATAATRDCMLALQCIGEFYVGGTRKKVILPAHASREAQNLMALFPTFAASLDAHRVAARESVAGRFSYWDAVLLHSADDAGCTVILSEDMHDGARLGGITVRNPFGPKGLSAAATAALAP